MRFKVSARDAAFVAVFAALSAVVIEVFPGIPIMGVSGSNIKFDAVLAPIYGLVIGPYLGFLAALIGGLITAGSPFSILTSFSPAVSAMVAGFLTQRSSGGNESRIKGWMLASLILGLLITGWYLTGVGQRAPFYPVIHVAALALVLVTRDWTVEKFREEGTDAKGWIVKPVFLLAGVIILVVAYMLTKPYSSDVMILPYLSLPMFLIGGTIVVYSLLGLGRSSFVSAVFVASYCAVIADHMLGNLVFIETVDILIPLSVVEEYFLKPLGLPNVPSLFMYMIPVSAIERILFAVVATILGVGLILALRRGNLLTRELRDSHSKASD